MPATNSRFAYHDCLEVFDRAIASHRGIRLRFTDEGSARQYAMRLHKARALHRTDNAATYPDGHPLHGRSEYDIFTVRVRGETEFWEILIERTMLQVEIEDL